MLTDVLSVDIGSAVEAVNSWLRDYVSQPHGELGRTGPVCPFVEPSQRANSLEIRVRLVGPAPSTTLLVEALRCALDEFDDVSWRGSNQMLRALVLAFPDLPDDRFALLDEAHTQIKSETMLRGLMIGQFHDRCDERAARNPEFRVSRSPVPVVAIRRMAIHDVLFLRDRQDWFEEYVTRFGERYRTEGTGLDPQFVEMFHKARADFGITWCAS
jgi:hypothetical protein